MRHFISACVKELLTLFTPALQRTNVSIIHLDSNRAHLKRLLPLQLLPWAWIHVREIKLVGQNHRIFFLESWAPYGDLLLAPAESWWPLAN